MQAKAHSFKVGDFECLVLYDQRTVVSPSELVANVGPEELEQLNFQLGLPAEGIALGYNCLLVRTGEENVLVDAGNGGHFEGREGALLEGLERAGIEAEQIDWIVVSHADRDHIGGILDPEGAFVYPNAGYVLWQGAWDFWQVEDNYRQWPQEMVVFVLGILSRLEPRLRLTDADEWFLPGLQIVPAVGHRHDHVVVRISSQEEQLLHLADAVIHPVLMERRDWVSTYDSMPDRALAVKERLPDLAAAEEMLVFGGHFPFPGLGYVQEREDGWAWVQVKDSVDDA